MPYCDASAYPLHMIVLTYLSVIIGAIVSLVAASIFAYKWFLHLDDQYKTNTIPRLCSVIIGFVAMERTVRVLEIFMWYYASKIATNVIHNSNNVIAVCGIFGCLFWLLTIKLQISFQGSAFSISDTEVVLLYLAIVIEILVTIAFWVFNGTPHLNSSPEGQLTTFILAGFALILGLIIVGRIDFDFGSRLRELVASSAVHCRPTALTLSSKISFDENGFPEQGTLERIRSATLSDYEDKHQSLLRTAAKSMVLAVWISCGICLSFFSGFLFSMGTCANVATVLGHLSLASAYIICALAISFTLPHSESEYLLFCSKCDYLIKKIVAVQTNHQVLVLHNQYSSNKTSTEFNNEFNNESSAQS